MGGYWRLIDSGRCSAYSNMAMDEAIAASVRKGDCPTTLRLYEWDRPSVTIGCFQKIRDIDIEYCRTKDIPIVRRPTGGRAILHNRELTYSFSSKTDNELFSKGILDSYKKISRAMHLALSKTGLPAEARLHRENRSESSPLCFQSTSYGEITVNNRKIIGSAQKRWTDGLLQQGSIPYHIEESEIRIIFRFQPSHGIKNVMSGLKDIIPELSEEEFRKLVRTSFEETFGVGLTLSLPSPEEEALALKLEEEKYRAPEWNFRR